LPSKHPALTFGDIIENIDRIRSYAAAKTQAEFFADQMLIDATERCLSRISEAAVKLASQAEEFAPEIGWKDIRGIGNHLRHDYRGVNLRAIWQVVCEDLAPLRAACVAARRKLAGEHEE
jgi:uncharacterized protein with HEPN domain